MSRSKRILIILFVLLLVISPVAAQDETTEEPDGVTVTIPGDGDGDGSGGWNIPINTIWDLLGVIIAFGATVVFTVAGLSWSIRQLRNDPDQMSIIERAFESIPSEIVETLNKAAEATIKAAELVRELGEFLHEATDGVPLADKDGTTTLSDATIAEMIAQLVDMGAIPSPEVNTDWQNPNDDPNLAGAAGQG